MLDVLINLLLLLNLQKNEYENYLLIDFSIVSDEIKEYFAKYINDLDYLFMLFFQSLKLIIYLKENL